jgi:hypothetical protein
LAAFSLSAGLAGTASAQVDYVVDGTGSQINFSCLGLIMGFTGNNCAFDGTNFTVFAVTGASGPVALASFHAPGDSPFDRLGVGDNPYTSGDGFQTAPTLLGTLTIDDAGGCDAGTTIAFDIGYSAGSRNFGGGPGTQGEESWDDGDLSFALAATPVSSAAANGAGGCDYVIGDAGAPPLITANGGVNVYGEDVNIDLGGTVWEPNDGTDYSGAQPSLSQVETGTPNVGAQAGQMTVTNGPSYACTFFSGGAVPCEAGGSHHEVATDGNREFIENTIVVISTDGGGNITLGQVYPVDEQAVGTLGAPQWNSPLWQFTAAAPGGAPTANDDSAIVLQDGNVDIAVMANDVNFVDEVTVVRLGCCGPAEGTTSVIGSPGPQAGIIINYDATGVAVGPQSFDYQVTDANGDVDQATVTVDVQADLDPVAPPGDIDVDTQGQNGAAATATLDVSTLPGFDAGNGITDCTITTPANNGTASCLLGVLTYVPDDNFTDGGATDSFIYELTDIGGGTDQGNIDVTITPVDPDIVYADVTTDVDTANTAAPTTLTPGNGAPDQHTIAVTADADPAIATCTVDPATFELTVTPAAEGVTACDVTLTDTDGDNPSVYTIAIDVTEQGLVLRLPGGSSALSPLSLLLLLGLPLLRRRRQG